MKLLDVLQGRWLGHPLHPAVAHIPLGTWIAAAIADAAVLGGIAGPATAQFSFWAVVLGLVSCLVAVPAGVADWTPIKKEKPAWKLGFTHMLLNLAAILVWAVDLGLRLGARTDGIHVVTPAILTTSIIGALLVIVSGYLGSLMVFDQGTSVARMSKAKWRSIAAAGGANLPERK